MLSIRLQRTGRKGHAQYRVVVQESRQSPTSGRFVAKLGSYNPHTKTATLDKEKASTYLKNGAQPSDRVVRLFEAEKLELPEWVTKSAERKRAIRNPEKLRKNQPKEEKAPEAEVAEEAAPPAEAPAETTVEAAPETPAEAEAEAEAPKEA